MAVLTSMENANDNGRSLKVLASEEVEDGSESTLKEIEDGFNRTMKEVEDGCNRTMKEVEHGCNRTIQLLPVAGTKDVEDNSNSTTHQHIWVYDKTTIKCNGRKDMHKVTGILLTILLSCYIPLGMADPPPSLTKENNKLTKLQSRVVAAIGCLSAMAIAIGLGHALRRCCGDIVSQTNRQRLERFCDYAVAANIMFCFFGNSFQTKYDLHMGKTWLYLSYACTCLSFLATGCVVTLAIYLHGRLRHSGRENYFSTVSFGIISSQFFLSTLSIAGEPTIDRFFLPFLTAVCDFSHRMWGRRNERNRTEESEARTEDRRQSGNRIDEEEAMTSIPLTLGGQNNDAIETNRLEELESQLTQLQEDLERAKEERNSFRSLQDKAHREAEEVKHQLKDMSGKCEDFQKQLLENETQLQKLDQLQKDLERAKEQANSSKSLKEKAQQEADEAKNQLKDMSKKLEDSQMQLLEKEIQLLVILEENEFSKETKLQSITEATVVAKQE